MRLTVNVKRISEIIYYAITLIREIKRKEERRVKSFTYASKWLYWRDRWDDELLLSDKFQKKNKSCFKKLIIFKTNSVMNVYFKTNYMIFAFIRMRLKNIFFFFTLVIRFFFAIKTVLPKFQDFELNLTGHSFEI